MAADTQGLDGVERILAAFRQRLDVIDVEGSRDERGAAFVAGVILANADALSFLCRPLVSFDATDLETETFRDLRHALATVHELSTGVEVQLRDRHLEDSTEDLVVAWHATNHEKRTRLGAHHQRRRSIRAVAVLRFDADLGSEVDLHLKGWFTLRQVGSNIS